LTKGILGDIIYFNMSKLRFLIAGIFFIILASITLTQPLRQTMAETAYIVSGFIRFPDGNPVSGVRVNALNIANSAQYRADTDGSGHYVFSFENGMYKIKPIKAGLNFFPEFRKVKVENSDVSGVNFIAR